jgi:ATP-dependent RNA helicase RhlE
VVLDGKDLLASAQTGTGKTASFVLPMVDAIAGRKGTLGLILAPTREIAQQIQATLDLFAKPRGLRSVVLIGGIDMNEDLRALRDYPEIIVATPGRLCDHLERGTVWLEYLEMVVLDEADRMLSMGFSDQLTRVMRDTPNSRQTLLFSATITPSIDKLAQKILYEPVRVAIGKPLAAAHSVTQKLIWMRDESKKSELIRLLNEEKGSIIVFVRSKLSADQLWRSLHSRGFHDCTCIHSDRMQSVREQALAEFKEGKFRILIATDVVGRGIHVDGIAHVVNFDLPLEAEDYVHRIGRTGRANLTGTATSFVTPRDRRLLSQIEQLLKSKIPAEYLDGLGSNGSDSGGDGGSSEQPRRESRGGNSGKRDNRGDSSKGRRPRRGGSGKRTSPSTGTGASPTPNVKPKLPTPNSTDQS